jgi:cytochrome b involved in lipid metabolism
MSKQTKIAIGSIVILVAALVAYATSRPSTNTAYQNPPVPTTTTTTPTTTGTPTNGTTSPATTVTSYTMANVATHNNASSCWTAINGNVYDVTSWINQHPGGSEAILSLCGTDGSSAFDAQHGGQRRPEQELASFKIGTLVK